MCASSTWKLGYGWILIMMGRPLAQMDPWWTTAQTSNWPPRPSSEANCSVCICSAYCSSACYSSLSRISFTLGPVCHSGLGGSLSLILPPWLSLLSACSSWFMPSRHASSDHIQVCCTWDCHCPICYNSVYHSANKYSSTCSISGWHASAWYNLDYYMAMG